MYWVNLINDRGHAGEFATANTPGVTEIVESSTTLEFAKALRAVAGISLTNITVNPQDPPDCLTEIDGRQVQIELVELVDGEALAVARKTGRTAHNDANQFIKAQWDADRFLSKVNAIIDNKDKKYQAYDTCFDCLLIYTGEPWLLPKDVSGWLNETEFHHRKSFRCVYLLMCYDPTYSQEHYPLFNIYGDLKDA